MPLLLMGVNPHAMPAIDGYISRGLIPEIAFSFPAKCHCLMNNGNYPTITLHKSQLLVVYLLLIGNTEGPANATISEYVKALKLDGAALPAEVTRPMPTRNEDHEREEYEESIEALKKLFEGRNTAPSGAVQTLLDKTRAHRKTWLQTAVSIHDIISTYLVLKTPKWVCLFFNLQTLHESG